MTAGRPESDSNAIPGAIPYPDEEEERFSLEVPTRRCPNCGHAFLPRYRRCRRCAQVDPTWSILDDPRIDRSGECWIWNGSRNTESGYGRFDTFYVHRRAWEEANGQSAEGFEVMHSCDNPPCCNPAHLSRGTHTDNMRDARSKGRLKTDHLMKRGEWTHCKRGHEFTDENTYRNPRGVRECRTCKRENIRRWKEKHNARA